MVGRGVRPRSHAIATGLAVVALLSGITIGCTGGDDGAEALVADDQGGASAYLAAAVARTRATSGRIQWTGTSELVQAQSGMTNSMEYSGADRRVTSEDSENAGREPATMLILNGSRYVSRDLMIGTVDGSSATGLPEELGAAEWIDVTDEDDVSVTDTLMTEFLMGVQDPFEMFGPLDDVADAGSELVDGDSFRRLDATMTFEEFQRAILGAEAAEQADSFAAEAGIDGDTDPEVAEQIRRAAAVREYEREHTTVSASVLIDDDGMLRRSTIVYAVDIEEEFAECQMLTTVGGATLVADYTDLGEPIDIPEPDPATVVTSARAAELLELDDDDEVEEDDYDDYGNDMADSGESGPILETSDGGWPRDDLIAYIEDNAELTGVDVATIESWSDEQLVATFEQVAAAYDALPKFETLLGPMTRSELLETTRLVASDDVDPASVETMTDEQLVELVNSYAQEDHDQSDDFYAGCPG